MSSETVRTAERLSLIGGCIAVAIAAAALAGWMFEIDAAKRWLSRQAAVNPLTAWCLIALAFSLFALRPRNAPRTAKIAGRAMAGAVLVLATLKLASVQMGWEFPLDGWLFSSDLATDAAGTPNRMATRTAMGFITASSALLLLEARWRRVRPAENLAFATGILALLSLVGYAYGVLSHYWAPNFVPMALPTAVAFFVFAAAILFARTESGAMAVVFSDTAGGFVARRLVPLALLLPVALGALRSVGERAGWYDTTIGVAHLATTFIVVFLSAIAWTAWLLFRVDRERAAAEAGRADNEVRLHELNADLEQRVAARTAELREANAQLHESGRLAGETLDALSAHIAIVDENGAIVNVNRAWRAFAADTLHHSRRRSPA